MRTISEGASRTARGPRRSRPPGFVAVIAVVVPLVAGGCSGGTTADRAVQPLVGGARASADVTDEQPEGTTPPRSATTTTSSRPDASTPPPSGPAHTERDELRSLVDDALLAYDRALTDLAADPAGRAAAGSPHRAAWDATVLPGSGLSSGVLGWLVRRHRQDGTVVIPDDSGLSYRHRALLVEPPARGAVSFTWCGHSPGLGIDAATGEVVDDGVAHAHGTGQLRSIDGRWFLEALDESDLEVLVPASPDPCPAEVAALIAAEGAGSVSPQQVGR